MGILASILGTGNPLAQWTLQNHGLLSKWGQGLAEGPDFQSGLAQAAQNGPAGQLIDQQYAKDQQDKKDRQDAINQSAKDLAKFPDLMQAIASKAITPAEAYSEAWKRQAPGYGGSAADLSSTAQGRAKLADQLGYTGDIRNMYIATGKLPGANDSSKFGNTPVMATDGKGNWIAVQPGSDGTTNEMQFPPGFHPDPGGLAGTKTTATVDAKTAGAARAALPAAEQAYTLTNTALDSLTGSNPNPRAVAGEGEQFSNTFGVPTGQMVGAIPGTYKSDFRNIVDQLSGQAFLNIRQALKGAGQVTDFEGAKGEIALSRMKAAAASGSAAEFNQALKDYKDAIDNGMRLLRAQANGDYSAGGSGLTGGDDSSDPEVEQILKGVGL